MFFGFDVFAGVVNGGDEFFFLLNKGIHAGNAEIVEALEEVGEVGVDVAEGVQECFARNDFVVARVRADVFVVVAEFFELFNNRVECAGVVRLVFVDESATKVCEFVDVFVSEGESLEPGVVFVGECAEGFLGVVFDDEALSAEDRVELVRVGFADFAGNNVVFAVFDDFEAGEFFADDFVREFEFVVVCEGDGEFVIAFFVKASKEAFDDGA